MCPSLLRSVPEVGAFTRCMIGEWLASSSPLIRGTVAQRIEWLHVYIYTLAVVSRRSSPHPTSPKPLCHVQCLHHQTPQPLPTLAVSRYLTHSRRSSLITRIFSCRCEACSWSDGHPHSGCTPTWLRIQGDRSSAAQVCHRRGDQSRLSGAKCRGTQAQRFWSQSGGKVQCCSPIIRHTCHDDGH